MACLGFCVHQLPLVELPLHAGAVTDACDYLSTSGGLLFVLIVMSHWLTALPVARLSIPAYLEVFTWRPYHAMQRSGHGLTTIEITLCVTQERLSFSFEGVFYSLSLERMFFPEC